MSREKRLVKNTIILSIGNLFTKLITFFLLPLYTAILSTEEYGLVDLLNTLVSLLLPIVTLQLEQAVFRNLIEMRDNEENEKKIISTSLFAVFFQCILLIILFFIISTFVRNKYKYFLLISVIVYIFSSLFQQIARGFGKNKSYTIGSIFSGIFTIFFNVLLLVVFKLQAYGMLIGTIIGQVACIFYLFFNLKIYKYFSFKFVDVKYLKSMLKYSLPLIPNSISWWVFNASDRLIVSFLLGLSYTGLLSAANKFSTIYIMIYNFFHLSWIETVSLQIKDKDFDTFFNNTFNVSLRFFLSFAFGIIAVMPFVYPIMINSKFSYGYFQVPILMLGSIFNVVVALETAIYVANKDTKSIAITSGLSAILNIIIHFLLINKIGLYAASISTFFAYFIMSIYRHFDIKKKYFNIRFEKKTIFISLLLLLILFPIYYIKNIYLCLVGIIITCAYVFIMNKEVLQFLFKKILKR